MLSTVNAKSRRDSGAMLRTDMGSRGESILFPELPKALHSGI